MNLLKKSLIPLALVCGGLLAYLCGTDATAFPQKEKPKPKLNSKAPVAHRLLVESTNETPAFKVTIAVDHEDQSYMLGEEVIVTVTSERDGYLYLFYADAAGNLAALFPNQYQKSNEIKAGTRVIVPDPSDKKFRIKVAEPTGQDILKAVVSTQPLKDLNTEELTRSTKPKIKLTIREVKRLITEAATGDPKLGDDDKTPVNEQINKQKQDNPEQIKQKCKEWAEASIILNTSSGKKDAVQDGTQKDKPTQDGPKQDGKQDGTQKDKPVVPTKDKPTVPTKDKPTQDGPKQDGKQDGTQKDKPVVPTKDKPTQDGPKQDGKQDGTQKDKPADEKSIKKPSK